MKIAGIIAQPNNASSRNLITGGIARKLIAPRTPWHNGKVERSHRSNRRHFYDWEKLTDVHELIFDKHKFRRG